MTRHKIWSNPDSFPQDKVTLRLYSGMVDAGKLDSAFDLVSRLHSEKSYDIAMRLADRNYKLADEVERLKKYKFPDDDASEDSYIADDTGASNTFSDLSGGIRSKQISPESRPIEKRNTMLSEGAHTENKRLRLK